jgi:hypothetical protein
MKDEIKSTLTKVPWITTPKASAITHIAGAAEPKLSVRSHEIKCNGTGHKADIIGYNEVTNIVLSLERDNEALNSSAQMVRCMERNEDLQHALRELRAAERRVTCFTAEILASVLSEHPTRSRSQRRRLPISVTRL